MKINKIAALFVMSGMLTFTTAAFAADEGATLYKSKCAACHKADGSGNPAMKAPALKGKTADDVVKAINTDAKHATLKKNLTAEQVKAISTYVASMK